MGASSTAQRVRATVRLVRERIAQIKSRKTAVGEQNTKAVLIDPIIEALGWDLRNLEEVVREYRAEPKDNPVDYALLLRRSPVLFIEAKDLGRNLADRRWASQVMGYATVVGVEWCVLTDGDEYRIYNAHAPVDVEEKLFRTVHISDEETEEHTVETLLLLSKEKLAANTPNELWHACFVDRQVLRALEAILASDDGGLVRLIRKRVPELKPAEIRQSLARADVTVSFPTTSDAVPPSKEDETEEGNGFGDDEKIVVIAGQPYECRYAKDILMHVANWLVAQGCISPKDCPIVVTRHAGRRAHRCLINRLPQHLDGAPFRAPKQLSNGLMIETHATRAGLERYARRLLEWAGIDPRVLVVHWAEP